MRVVVEQQHNISEIRQTFITRSSTSRVYLLLAAAAAVLSSLLLLSQGLQPCDDAYITFRHATNLATHGQPAWNLHGPPVLGSTAPAFVFTIAAYSKIAGIPTDGAALHLNALFLAGIVMLTFFVFKDLQLEPFAAILGSLLVGISSACIHVYSQGFENAMLVFLLLGSFYCYSRGHRGVAIMLASIAPLVRPEGIIAWLILAVYMLLRKQWSVRLATLAVAIPLLWVAFSVYYYGSPIPHPITAKKSLGVVYQPYELHPRSVWGAIQGVPFYGLFLAKLAARAAFQGTILTIPLSAFEWLRIVAGLLGVAFFLLHGRGTVRGKAYYFLYIPLFLAFYGYISHANSWYFPSIVTFVLILFFVAGVTAIRTLLNLWTHRFNPQRYSLFVFLFFLLILSGNNYDLYHAERWFTATDIRGLQWEGFETQRFLAYKNAANLVNLVSTPESTVLTPEVGFFGFHYKGNVIDSVGLCSPEVLKYFPPPPWDVYNADGSYASGGSHMVPSALVIGLQPDFVVAAGAYIGNLLRPYSVLQMDYLLLGAPSKAWATPVFIYARAKPRD